MRSYGARRVGLGSIAPLGALMVCSMACAQSIPSAAPGLRVDAPIDANRPYAQELTSSAARELVIAVAGSLVIDSPLATLPAWDPMVIELLNGRTFAATATVAVADLQTTLIDPATFAGFPYGWDGSPAYATPPGIAVALRHQGLSMLARANSHALDWGIDGMRATSAALEAAGLKHAGTGDREGLARMASFLDEPSGKGRIALIATATSFRPTTNALSAHGAAPGRAGISAIELLPVRLVPAQERAQLQRMACRFQHPSDPEHCEHLGSPPATVSLFGNRFRSGTTARADYRSDYEVNQVQVANELRAVREAKQNSDLVILSVATGQADLLAPTAGASAPVLERLAHAAIEAGADIVMATGSPALGPIEIYQPVAGPPRPILYGMGRLYCSSGAAALTDRSENLQSIIVRSGIDGNRLTVEIYPIDLSAGNGPAGIPRLASAARGREILARLQSLSAPFHTEIRTEPYGATIRGLIVVSAGAVSVTREGT
ncbi:MAG TPA: CapA family protein [Steroidobacteraceae bacterium]|nr:CapA family protein [Steroidobacteraceae bacterium]